MQNDDGALLSISLKSCGYLVNMIITLEPHGLFSLIFANLHILRMSSIYQIKLNNNKQTTRKLSKHFFSL